MRALALVGFLLCMGLFSSMASASVRTLHTNDKMMQTVKLQMGRSTVLRFLESPKKVIIGNSNYISAEFIGNDVTLQPLGAVSTNIFIYTEFRTYGLILKVSSAGVYDDLVYVKWKPKYYRPSGISHRRKASKDKGIGRTLHLNKVLALTIGRVFESSKENLYVVEMTVQNKSKEKLKTSEVNIELTRRGQKLKKQDIVFKDDYVEPLGTTQARAIVTLESRRGFTLWVSTKGKRVKTIIPKALL